MTFRFNTYTEGLFYRLSPVYRQAVVPGQSVALDVRTEFETPAFLQNVMNPGVMQLFAFYTPYRLLWDQWVDFIARADGAPTAVPVTTTPWPAGFEGGLSASVDANVFGRRAFKLTYNEFFGSEQFGQLYDITVDTDVTGKPTKTLDQWLTSIMNNADTPETDFDVPVSGTAPNQVATIPLNQLREQMRFAYSQRRADMTGEKYVDAMLRMGVKLDWRVQNSPEFLGSATVEFAPKETRSSYTPADPAPAGSAVTGRAYARYQGEISLKTKRRFFAEHGEIQVLALMRPFDFDTAYKAPAFASLRSIDQFFLGDNSTGTATYDASRFTGAAAGAERLRVRQHSWYSKGHNARGIQSPSPWLTSNTSTGIDSAVYGDQEVDQDGSITRQVALFSRGKGYGPTPVKPVF